MCRVGFLLLVSALTSATWSNCQAAGSFQRPKPRVVVTAGFAPNISLPNVTANDLVGGCGGKGRVRDLQTHSCLGPADIR